MRIAVIGPGAMGQLYGGYLASANEVVMIGRNPEAVKTIREEGITIEEKDGSSNVFRPDACLNGTEIAPCDLVILFVKSAVSIAALEGARSAIGPDTFLMTLQNGAGHEDDLLQFADREHVLIGVTMHGSVRRSDHEVFHSGGGATTFGPVTGEQTRPEILTELEKVRKAFSESGFDCVMSTRVQENIWKKLSVNASSSVLTGILQVAQGYIAADPYAWDLCQKLIREICAVATADGYPMDADQVIADRKAGIEGAPLGYTSIYADLHAGRKTEVDVISGAVVKAAHRLGIAVPYNEMALALVHAMENRSHSLESLNSEGVTP